MLERTPPPTKRVDRRAESGTPQPSSPLEKRSGAATDRSVPATNEYIFPSLDAIAAPFRERNAAIAYSSRSTPSLHALVRSKENVEGSNGLYSNGSGGSSSSSRIMAGGYTGRTGVKPPLVTARHQTNLGERRSPQRASRSPVESPIRRQNGTRRESPQRALPSPSRVREQESPLPPPPAADYDTDRAIKARASYSERAIDVHDDYQAMIDKALASGADPFKDRKKDQMREEVRMAEAAASAATSQSNLRLSQVHSPGIRKSISEEAHTTNGRLLAIQSSSKQPLSRTSDVAARRREDHERLVSKHAAEIERMQKLLEQSKSNATTLTSELRLANEERNRLAVMNTDLESRSTMLQQQMKALQSEWEQEKSLQSLRARWKLTRYKCSHAINAAEECKERDVEIVVLQNEVTRLSSENKEAQLLLLKSAGQAQARTQEVEEVELASKKRLEVLEAQVQVLTAEQVKDRAKSAQLEQETELLKAQANNLETEIAEIEEELVNEKGETVQLRRQLEEATLSLAKHSEKKMPSSPARRIREEMAMAAATVDLDAKERGSEDASKAGAHAASRIKPATTLRKRKESLQQVDEGEVSSPQLEEESPKPVAPQRRTVKQTAAAESREAKGRSYGLSALDPNKGSVGNIFQRGRQKQGAMGAAAEKGSRSKDNVKDIRESGPAAKSRKATAVVTAEESPERPHGEVSVMETPLMPTKKTKGNVEAEQDSMILDARTPMIATAKTRKQKVADRVDEDSEAEEAVELANIPQQRALGKEKHGAQKAAKASKSTREEHDSTGASQAVEDGADTAPVKKKRRLLKPARIPANNFLNLQGDVSGDLDPVLQLPTALSPIKGSSKPSAGLNRTGGGLGGIRSSRR